ncbi:MAG: hypothetical protein HYU75_06490 [Betaproteobacteria bacterium]|nr:hypothetical protein [Betaproteobacteria bacterium]
MSGLIYERGDPAQPVGHAFLYFGARGDEQVLATYVVVPPIAIDLAKYMPPMFAAQLGAGVLAPQAPFLPIPPVPEPIGISQILGLAELRSDDILVGGPHAGAENAPALLNQVVEIADTYAQAYRDSITREPVAPRQAETVTSEEESPQVRALMYATVSEHERLETFARQLGSLRYGLEVRDAPLVEATLAEMRAIASSLPGKYRALELIRVAPLSDAASVRLTELYLERAFKLSSEEYEELAKIDAEIESLWTPEDPGRQT